MLIFFTHANSLWYSKKHNLILGLWTYYHKKNVNHVLHAPLHSHSIRNKTLSIPSISSNNARRVADAIYKESINTLLERLWVRSEWGRGVGQVVTVSSRGEGWGQTFNGQQEKLGYSRVADYTASQSTFSAHYLRGQVGTKPMPRSNRRILVPIHNIAPD